MAKPVVANASAHIGEQLDAVREVLRTISRSPYDLDAVLGIAAARAERLAHGDSGFVYLPVDGAYRLAAFHGGLPEMAEYESQHLTPVTRGTLVGRVVLSGHAVQIKDVLADPAYEWKQGAHVGRFRTLLGIPIRTEERLVGVFGLARATVRAFSKDEIELTQTFADQAAIVIENVRLLATIERQREELARYLPSTVAGLVSSPEGQQLLAGHRREVTAVFCDLRGFTAFAEAAEPEEVLDILREYHREMGAIIVAHHGTVEHYAGDGMMIFLNDPEPIVDHTIEAARMALAMRARFGDMSAQWRRQGFELGQGIGIAVGYATLGRIGFEGHYAYAVIGRPANLAARLCAIAEPGQIVMSGRAYSRLEDRATAESLGALELKGFRRAVEAFALTDLLVNA